MYRKVAVESTPLTPELAQRFSEMMPLPGERSMRPSRRLYLLAQILRNKFSGPDWSVGTCVENGEVYRLDGQHSSHLLANLPANVVFPSNLLATITNYEFDTMSDATDVFNLFNNPHSVRNNVDMMGTFAAAVPELTGYSREYLVDVADGICEHEQQRKRKGAKDTVVLTPRDRGGYWLDHEHPEFVAFVHWLGQFREKKNATFLHRAIIVADMIDHHLTYPVVADEFWPLVFAETHPDPDHETRVLAEKLREMLAVSGKPRLDQALFRKHLRRAWKQFRTADNTAAA